MDKRTSNRRKRRLQEKRLAPVFLFILVAALFYWLSFRVFTATDCEFFGSKIALVIVPACAAFGNQGVAVFPFLIASASLFMGIVSLRAYRNLTLRSTRPARKAAQSG
jgi:hypothetical protein